MNYGAGAAAGVGAVLGLFAGAFAGKALGGTNNELVGATLVGAAGGAFVGTILTAPDVATTTTTSSTIAGLPAGAGKPRTLGAHPGTRAAVARLWQNLAPASPMLPWNATQWSDFYWSYNLPQGAAGYKTMAQVQTLGNVITALAGRARQLGLQPMPMVATALSMLQKQHTAVANNLARQGAFGRASMA